MVTVIPRISRLTPSVIRILGCNPGPMTLQGTNTYLIGTGHRRLLLDTGESENKEYLSLLQSVLKEQNVMLSTIVVSHWHVDHIGGVPDVLRSLAGDVNVEVKKFPRPSPPDDPIHGVDLQPLSHHDEIRLDGATLRVHHTPGHSTDHIILQLLEDGAVFSGDCILGEGTAVFEDLHDYMGSLQRILELNPTVIYPGHGPVIEDPRERIREYIAHRNLRENQILEVLHDGSLWDIRDIVKKIYVDTPEHLHRAAGVNVYNHLTKLLKEKKVQKEGERWAVSALKHHL